MCDVDVKTVLVAGGVETIKASIRDCLTSDGFTVIIGALNKEIGQQNANDLSGNFTGLM